jgi:hypothetical protein
MKITKFTPKKIMKKTKRQLIEELPSSNLRKEHEKEILIHGIFMGVLIGSLFTGIMIHLLEKL